MKPNTFVFDVTAAPGSYNSLAFVGGVTDIIPQGKAQDGGDCLVYQVHSIRDITTILDGMSNVFEYSYIEYPGKE